MSRLVFTFFFLNGLASFGQPFASSRAERDDSGMRFIEKLPGNAKESQEFVMPVEAAFRAGHASPEPSVRYAVKSVSFNSSGMDFSPFPYKNGIVFVSSRHEKGSHGGEDFLNLFYTEEKEDGTFSTPQLLNRENVSPYHLGPAVFFNQGKKKIVTRNSFYKQRKVKDGSTQTLELALSELTPSGKWTELVALPLSAPDYSVGHPAVSSDGNTLYFSSNMPGTLGGSDLFVSHYENGIWSIPQNLGATVNTAGQELFPYLQNDSILYFSSTNHHSLGGLDVFYCNLKSAALTVIPLDAPVNSTEDDFGIFLDSRARSGFFSSNRSGPGEDDIYYFEEIRQFARIELYDSLTGDHVRDASIVLYGKDALLDRAESDLMGSAQFRLSRFETYKVHVLQPQYKTATVELRPAEWPGSQEARVKVYLSPLNEKIVARRSLVALQTTERKALTNTISFSSAPLDIDVVTESLSSAKDTPVVASTDSLAVPLVKVIAVENVSGLPFIMVSRNDSIYEFKVVSQSELGNTELNIKINIPQGAKRNDYEKIITDEIAMQGYGISRFLLIRSFYFDSEKALIRNDASAQLDKIIEVMVTNPEIDVQLIFHSDSRGTNKFNLELSKRRSEEVTGYLTLAGIASQRILSHFVGESQPLNDCGDLSDCDELLHQMNRTVEFELIRRSQDPN